MVLGPMTQQPHPTFAERHDPATRILDHDPGWLRIAAGESGLIREALGELLVRIDHVGSTSVPGLAAKPIVDLQASVTSLDPIDPIVSALTGLGFMYAPHPDFPDYVFFAKPPERPRSFHLHVCEAGSDQELRHLAVRDYLREHAGERAAYGEIKRALVTSHPEDRLEYIAGKDAFVKALEQRAVAWARGRDDS
jgi:GrpB-like predicted nucleotidyltransferase (UPF0157 family)